MGGWEWIILLLILVAIPVVVITLIVRATKKTRQEQAAQQDAMFAAIFTGAPTVIYQLTYGAAPYESVVTEAVRRGYRLDGQNATGLLTFSR